MAPPRRPLCRGARKRLPAYASFGNPIDMTANVIFDPALMAGTLRDVVRERRIRRRMLCVNLIWRQGAALAEQLAAARRRSGRRLLGVAWIAGKHEPLDAPQARRHPGIRRSRALREGDRGAAALGSGGTRDVDGRAAGGPDSRAAGDFELISAFAAQEAAAARTRNTDRAPSGIAREGSMSATRMRCADLGYPVAAKLVARGLAHKSEIGGVHLGIDSDAALGRDDSPRSTRYRSPARRASSIQRMVGGAARGLRRA